MECLLKCEEWLVQKKEEIKILIIWVKQAFAIFSVFLVVSLDGRNLC